MYVTYVTIYACPVYVNSLRCLSSLYVCYRCDYLRLSSLSKFTKESKSGVLNLLVLVYPQINVVPQHVPPNNNLIQIVPSGQKISKKNC